MDSLQGEGAKFSSTPKPVAKITSTHISYVLFYQMQKTGICGATNNEHRAGTSSERTPSDRNKKCPLTIDQLLEHHIKDKGKRIRFGGNLEHHIKDKGKRIRFGGNLEHHIKDRRKRISFGGKNGQGEGGSSGKLKY